MPSRYTSLKITVYFIKLISKASNWDKFFQYILANRSLFPFQVFIVPPLYRHQPAWYHRNLALVATRFSQALSSTPPLNLHLLPSFTSQDLCPDGVFLTPVSGLHYVLHVFDQTSRQLELLQSDSTAQLVHVQESVRHHDDRLSYLKGRHDRLSVSHDTKLAADAEFRDWMINRSEESWFTIQGLPRLGQKGRREWQDAARKQVNDLFRLTLKLNKVHLDYKVIVVNLTFSASYPFGA